MHNTRRVSVALYALLVYAVLALLAVQVDAIGVVSIDYGTEWMKVALIKPGKPFDLVLGRDSKRKIQASVAFKGAVRADGILEKQERIMGGDAYAYASRDPLQSYHAAKLLLGQSCNGSTPAAAQMYTEAFGNLIQPLTTANGTGSSCLVRPSATVDAAWRPEEIVGMQLDHLRELAEDTAGEMLSIGTFSEFGGYFGAQHGLDTVMTVPIFFTSHERQALLDSAVLAGFRPRLISDGAAVAVNYAQSRSFSKPERHIFFDAGSSSVTASFVELADRKDETQKTTTAIRVLDATWARETGGLEMDFLLRDMLSDAFDKQHTQQESVRSDKRAMARLLREANRVKHILSANTQAVSRVESVSNDLDLYTTIERDEFEQAMKRSGLLDRIAAPLKELAQRNKLKLGDVHSVILVGGTTRIPSVQAVLRTAGVPQDKIATNVNADEAAVMGAAVWAANLQPSLRVKRVHVEDGNMYAVELTDSVAKKPNVVFPTGPLSFSDVLYDAKNIQQDLTVALSFTTDSAKRLSPGQGTGILSATLEGITERLAPLKEVDALKHVDLRVNASVVGTPFGTYSLQRPMLRVTPRSAAIAAKLPSLMQLESETTSNTSTNATEPSMAPVVVNIAARLTYLGAVRPLQGQDKLGALERLRLIIFEAKDRAAKDTAFNELESFLYHTRDLLDDPEFKRAAQPKEHAAIIQRNAELFAYHAEEADAAATKEITKRTKELEKLVKPVRYRLEQESKRAPAVAAMRTVLTDTTAFVAEARANLTKALEQAQGSKYTATELDNFASSLEKDERWLQDGVQAQAKRALHEDPAITVEEMERRTRRLRDTVARLRRRRITKTPAKKSMSASTATTSAAASTVASTAKTSTAASASASAAHTSTNSVPVHDDL